MIYLRGGRSRTEQEARVNTLANRIEPEACVDMLTKEFLPEEVVQAIYVLQKMNPEVHEKVLLNESTEPTKEAHEYMSQDMSQDSTKEAQENIPEEYPEEIANEICPEIVDRLHATSMCLAIKGELSALSPHPTFQAADIMQDTSSEQDECCIAVVNALRSLNTFQLLHAIQSGVMDSARSRQERPNVGVAPVQTRRQHPSSSSK